MAGVNHYNTKGLYTQYDKNHKERDALDYYSTPTEEVFNILDTLQIDLNDCVVLEPCAGGGHMVNGILKYKKDSGQKFALYCTDVQKRDSVIEDKEIEIQAGKEYDFLEDNFPPPELKLDKQVDWIIMNPPFSVIEPFTIRALELAHKGVIMLGRTQFLEGQSRYEQIFSKEPPTEVWTYVDRIQCYKNGDTDIKGSSAQAYSWFIWDKTKALRPTVHKWIRRADKVDKK